MSSPVGVLRRSFGYASTFPALGVGTLCVLLVGSSLAMTGPLLVRRVIDDGISAQNLSAAGLWSLVYLGVELLRSVVEAAQSCLLRAFSQSTATRIRSEVFTHVQRLPLRWFDVKPAGEVAGLSTSEVTTLGDALSAGLIGILRDGLVLVLIVILVLSLSPRFGGTIMLSSLLAAVPAFLFRRTAQKRATLALEAATSMNVVLEENLSGSLVIRLFGLESTRDKRFLQESDRALSVALSTLRARVLFDGGATVSSAVALTLVLCLGGTELAEGRITAGLFVAFIQYGSYLLGCLRGIADKSLSVFSGIAAGERIWGTLETPTPSKVGVTSGDPVREPAALVVEELRFGYEPGREVLQGLSLRVEKGTKVALVGKTGVGKTTLARVLARLYEPRSGTVRLGGKDLRTMEEGELRRRIVYVTQQVSIFQESVLENIRLGDPGIGRAEVIEACRAVHADRFIERLPGDYDALLGEGGYGLSAGQRQLLSFARVLVRKPDVLLLDEPTAHVDPETEGIILQAMERVLGRTTSVVIAHRYSTLRGSDRVVVMKEGRLEEGSPEEWTFAGMGRRPSLDGPSLPSG